MALKAGAQYAMGSLNRQRGDYELALDWLGQVKEIRKTLGNTAELAQVLIETGARYYSTKVTLRWRGKRATVWVLR